jgi:hypothetical protein
MSSAMSVFDSIWHPAAVDPQIEIQQAYEREAPAPAAEDDDDEDGAGGPEKAAGTGSA